MDAIDRRNVLRGILCAAVAAGVGANSFPSTTEAMPLALEKDLGSKVDDLKVKTQAVPSRPPGRPAARPPRRPPPRRPHHRRRRRWVCWWHRGRRVCGWR